MIFYILTIAIGMAVISAVNILLSGRLYGLPWYFIVLAVVIDTVAVIAVDGLFAFIIRRLPEKWFSPSLKRFTVKKGEQKFYDIIGVRKWKDKVLELGQFTKFTKKKVVDPSNNEYVHQFLLECNYGFVIHAVLIFAGFLIIFFYPLKYSLMFGVPVAAVNAFLNALPCFILRYNTPKLQILYKRNQRNARLKAAEAEQSQSA